MFIAIMTLLLLMIICVFMIIFYSNKMPPSSSASISPELKLMESGSLKQNTIEGGRRDKVTDNIRVCLNRINSLDQSVHEILRNQSEKIIQLERHYDSRLRDIIQQVEATVIDRTLEALTLQLLVSSQSFGYDHRRRDGDNKLDSFNNLIRDLAQYDICAIQDVSVPQSRWDRKRPGVTEIFKPILNKRCHHLVLRSFVKSAEKVNRPEDVSYIAFGFYINPNFNFQFDKNSDVETILNSDGTGVLLMKGLLFDQYRTIFASIRGTLDRQKGIFNNQDNIDLVTRTLTRIAEIGVHFYVLIGDFRLSNSVFVNALTTTWRPILPDLLCESDVLSEGSLLSSFDEYGHAQPDHLLTNMRIVDFRLFNAKRLNRMRLTSVLYPLSRQSIIATNSKTRKLNVTFNELEKVTHF